MKKFAFLPIAVLLCLGSVSVAGAEERRIAVEGIGRVSAEPDMARVGIAVQREAIEAGAAMAAASEAMTAVLVGIAAAGIAEEDVQTTGVGLEPQWRYSQDGAPPKVVGYVASNRLSVTVRDLGTLGGLLDGVVSEGANAMDGLSFDISNREALEDKARALAVADAARKAAILAEAAGEPLGPVVTISEGGGAAFPLQGGVMAMEAARSVPVAAGQIDVTVSVSAVYAIAE